MDSEASVFGAADGLTLVIGLIMGLYRTPHFLIQAAVSGGLAELVGMSAGYWLSHKRTHVMAALTCGVASCLGCIIPSLPYTAMKGPAALLAALGIAVVVGGLIAYLRPEHGWLAIVETYGILIGAGLLTFGVSYFI